MLHAGQPEQVVCLAEGLTALAAFAGKLDGMCVELGVATLSSFFDRTDAQADLDELDLLIDDGSHLASQGVWHEAATLLATLRALHEELTARPRRFGLLSNKYDAVLGELGGCVAALSGPSRAAARAHLLVLE